MRYDYKSWMFFSLQILRCCNSKLASTRNEACALMYILMRSNFEFSQRKSFTRVHLQVGYEFIFVNKKTYFTRLRWHRGLKSFLVEDKELFILHGQYHGCWCRGVSRNQGISSNCLGLVNPRPINSLRPSDAIWQHRSGSKLAQVMARCHQATSHYHQATSHYLSQCWLIISEVLWQSY